MYKPHLLRGKRKKTSTWDYKYKRDKTTKTTTGHKYGYNNIRDSQRSIGGPLEVKEKTNTTTKTLPGWGEDSLW